MIRRNAPRVSQTTRNLLRIGVSALALSFAAQAVAAQTQSPGDASKEGESATTPAPSNAVPPIKPASKDAPATFSGNTSVPQSTASPVAQSAGGTSGTSGTSSGPEAAPPATDRDEIVVTGIRQSLANAQAIKRNADTVVDAITAEDIGALPDQSVNEALQRVPGVAISRFAAPSDSQHFSVQGSGVVIRGLNYVRGEFNGRDAFAVNGGREIGFNDIPTELVGSVEVFKNLTPDLVEGGIAGTVNINTRKPFDAAKNLLYLSGGINYGDLEQRGAPQGVALITHNFDLGSGGRFGVLASVTYSQIRSRADSVFVSSFLPRYNDDTNGNGVQDPGEGRIINAGTPYQSTLFDTFPVPSGRQSVYVPLGAGSRTQDFDRKRFGISGAVQYENAARTLLVTGQFLRTESTEEWIEHTEEPNVYYGDVTTTFPVNGSVFTYDDDGIFTSGTLGKTSGAVQGNPYGGGAYGPLTQFAPNGIFTTESNRGFYSKSTTQDQSLNIKFDPTPRLHFNLDGQYVTSKLRKFDDILDTATFAQAQVDLRGNIPQIQFVTPGFDTNSYFANPNSIYFRDAFNDVQINDGKEYALRGDAAYDISDDGFLKKIRIGGRYADRKQTVRDNDYNNWGYLSETWSANGPVSFADIPSADGQLHFFDRFFRNQAVQPPAATFVPADIIGNHDAFTALLRQVTKLGGGGYTPLEDRTNPNGGDLIDGYFLPSEIYKNSEKTIAAYARIDFGRDAIFGGATKFSGNLGLRFVHTQDVSQGAITFPQNSTVLPVDTSATPNYTDLASYCAYSISHPNGQGTIPTICTLSAAQQQAVLGFSNGASVPNNGDQSFNDWLPSLNMRLDLTPKFLVRFAASRAISRPDFGQLRNFVGVGASPTNSAGNFGFQANAQNPYLRPVEANQFDLTAEWYFAKVGQLTGAVFYKDLSNIIVANAGLVRTLTNNGQTFDVTINGPANVAGHASIKGAEVSYQQTLNFLPGELRGLGVQATYTYVDAGKIPNGIPANGAADGSRPPLDVSGIYDNLPLAGLSKHNFNVAGFYDLHGIYTRFAYSWRSKFLLTNRDCCFPFLPVYSLSAGQLDGSFFYTVNPNFKIGVEAQNLLDTTTRTSFVLNADGLEAPRSYFKSDRQFTITTRLTF